jgi:OOP family OmpA-OmpF porin
MIATGGVAAANDHGFYAGVDAGIAAYPSDAGIELTTPFKRDSVDSSDFAWAFAAGYRFNRFVAVEAGFADLGELAVKLVDASGTTTAQGKISLTARGKTLAVLAHAPVGNWDPYLKVGVIQSIVDVRFDAKLGNQGMAFSQQQREPKLLVGLGARYAYSERWALSFAFDYYDVHMDSRTGIDTAHITSPRIGFAYRF